MKRNMRYIMVLMGAIAVLSACVEENFEDTIKVQEGDEIIFGARAGYENNSPDTKTIYKGKDSYYTVGDKTMEAVHWLPGDKVMIYCDQGQQTAHYQVTTTGTGDNTEAETSLQKMQLHGVGNNGIQWQNIKENDHTFYAVYPSPYQFSTPNVDSGLLEASGYQDRITGDGTTLNCYLPVSQAPSKIEEVDGNYVAYPNMDYAYMVAKQIVKANADGVVPAGVDLDFRPIVTALEVTMTVPASYTNTDGSTVTYEPFTISNVRIEESQGNAIVGPFSLDLKDYTYSENEVTYPSVTIPTSTQTLNSVSVQLYEEVDGLPKPLEIESGKTITFTVFMLPVDITNLNIVVDIKTGSLEGLKIEAHKKQFLVNLELPAASSETPATSGSNWVSQLPENVVVSGLSIPGTANSFSYNYTNGGINNDATTVDNNYMTQTLSFESQWNLGVRCFEIVCDRNRSTGSTATLAEQDVMCNGQSVGLNVTEAFDKVVDKLQAEGNEKEFAMIIVTYQPVSGGPERNPSAFMTQLKNFYENYEEGLLSEFTSLYTPGMTVQEVREKPLMIVARPTSEGEDTDITVGAGAGYNILTVKGWGTLVDKWYKRGYDAMLFKGKKDWYLLYGTASDCIHTTLPAMEDYIYGSSGEYNGTYDGRPTRTDGNQRFTYESDQNYSVWAQEWRRIAKEKSEYSYTSGFIGTKTNKTLWDESLSLKKEDILDTFERCISDNSQYVYFNSLDGFYIINDQSSCDYYYYGNMGDIGSYANDINSWFYPLLLEYSASDVTGSLGVVILDRVSNDGGPGELLPEVIYMNNWRHSLETGTTAQ